MRIHVQNPPHDPHFRIPPQMWQAATTRAGDAARSSGQLRRHRSRLRRGHSRDRGVDRRQGRDPRLAALRRAPTALLFVTNAGLDNLAPFDWLPPGVTLLNNRGTHVVQGRRVRPHGAADAGQSRAGDGDAPARRAMAEAVGRGAGRAARDRGRDSARSAGRWRRRRRGSACSSPACALAPRRTPPAPR